MYWYLVFTKPRQEEVALVNLEKQGYSCYLPKISKEIVRSKKLVQEKQPMFSRYIFLEENDFSNKKGLSTIKSTIGVSNLVVSGNTPLKAKNDLIDTIKNMENNNASAMFKTGDKIRIKEGTFKDYEGIFHAKDGSERAIILINMLNKIQKIKLSVSDFYYLL